VTTPLLTPAQMAAADAAAMAAGTPGYALMRRAGRALYECVTARFAKRPVLVLAGPGNNGGDGCVAARHLAVAGWDVRVACAVPREALQGDAARAAADWPGPVGPLERADFSDRPLVLDALFGTGLARPLSDTVRSVLNRARGLPVVAVDIPSGVDGATGAADPAALRADLTVTFAAKKLGHVLHPGAALCGQVVVADIGIPTGDHAALENGPELWRLPVPSPGGHKYDRGHAVVFGGPRMTGAGVLAATAAARAGAGLVTLVAPPRAAQVYRCTLPPHILCEPLGPDPAAHISDTRRNVYIIGPGGGDARDAVLALLHTRTPAVLDADALTGFENEPDRLTDALHPACVLTPHEGEAARLFGPLPGSKIDRAQAMADRAGCTVLLKGPDTVIAAPRAPPIVNTTGTPYLATAGAGDVLAGLIAGLMAQGMAPRDAAAAGAWMHGKAAELCGPGLVAPDLTKAVRRLWASRFSEAQ
jgi:ADP-dependent NAD(P)H-hydrate dehydratase / NAD(P)H-hydrate epimerase